MPHTHVPRQPPGRAERHVDLRGVVGHRQVTDSYLCALARFRGGRLVTLDRGLSALHGDVTELLNIS